MNLFAWRKPAVAPTQQPQLATRDDLIVISRQLARVEEKADKLAEWMTVLLRAEIERRENETLSFRPPRRTLN